MSRKTKPGIDYFPHDVDCQSDLKLKLVFAIYGVTGYAVYFKLLEEIYRGEGYYLQISEDFNILFSNECKLDLNVYIEVLNVCVEKKLFDKALYEKYKILTSKRIQSNYCGATLRRNEVSFIADYLLIDVESKYNLEKINVCINSLNVDINSLNVDVGTESRVEGEESKRRVKKRVKEKKTYVEDSNEFRLALYLFNHIKKNRPNFREPDLQKWAHHADLLLRVDKMDLEEIKKVIKFVQSDDFEMKNVLSIKKLRDRYDQLAMKMQKTNLDEFVDDDPFKHEDVDF